MDWTQDNYGTRIAALYNQLRNKIPDSGNVQVSGTLNLRFTAQDLASRREQRYYPLLVSSEKSEFGGSSLGLHISCKRILKRKHIDIAFQRKYAKSLQEKFMIILRGGVSFSNTVALNANRFARIPACS